MGSFQRSLRLARASFAVLRSEKDLLLFPFLSFLGLLVVLAIFAIPFFGIVVGTREGSQVNNVALFVLGFLFYIAAYTVTFFFQTALVGAALIKLDGRDPSVRDGLRIAISRLPTIVAYAIIAATVGQVLKAIRERAGILGGLLVSVLGFAWAVATFLVVPVLAAEGIGPIAAIKRSMALLRQTWGEQLVGSFGIGLVFTVIGLIVLLLGAILVVVMAKVSVALLLVAVVLTIIALGIVALVASALTGIYTASLYRYATTGNASMFDSDTLAGAFRSKGGGPSPQYGVPR